MFWKNNQTEKKLEALDYAVRASFSRVKNDTKNAYQWITYLNRKAQYQDQQIRKLNEELSMIPKSPEDIRKIVDSYYSYEGIMKKIEQIRSRIDEIEYKQKSQQIIVPQQVRTTYHHDSLIEEITKRLQKLEHKKITIREKIMKRLTKNSKDYVTGMMLSYIKKYESISATQLKEIVVDEQSLCSKSSFYRLLEEIENNEEIGVVKKGKEKQYLYKIKNF